MSLTTTGCVNKWNMTHQIIINTPETWKTIQPHTPAWISHAPNDVRRRHKTSTGSLTQRTPARYEMIRSGHYKRTSWQWSGAMMITESTTWLLTLQLFQLTDSHMYLQVGQQVLFTHSGIIRVIRTSSKYDQCSGLNSANMSTGRQKNCTWNHVYNQHVYKQH